MALDSSETAHLVEQVQAAGTEEQAFNITVDGYGGLTWADLGSCSDDSVDKDLFFPGPKDSAKAAKAICESCDVRLVCLEVGLRFSTPQKKTTNNERWGIWGGKTVRERQVILKRRHNKAA